MSFNTVTSHFDIKKLREDLQTEVEFKDLLINRGVSHDFLILKEFCRIKGYFSLIAYLKNSESALYFKTVAEDLHGSSIRDNTYDQRVAIGISNELSDEEVA